MTVPEILEKLTLTDAERNLLAGGFCPKCKIPMRGRFDPVGNWHFMAPEIYATLREKGIDTQSGHKNSCPLRHVRLP